MRCQAVIETMDPGCGGKEYSRQGIRIQGSKPCSREATARIGGLCLCQAHAKMALQGFVGEDGTVAPKVDIAVARRYPAKFPRGLSLGRWAVGLQAESLS